MRMQHSRAFQAAVPVLFPEPGRACGKSKELCSAAARHGRLRVQGVEGEAAAALEETHEERRLVPDALEVFPQERRLRYDTASSQSRSPALKTAGE